VSDLAFTIVPPAANSIVTTRGGAIVRCGDNYVGVIWPVALAERICELLNEHGAMEPINTIDQQGETP
jgi:hypothetical protein